MSETLVQQCIKLINRIYSDVRVSKETTRDMLNEIKDEIELLIDALDLGD